MQAPVKAALDIVIGPEIVCITITTNTAQPLRITGTDPLRTGPVYSHGLLPTPVIYHLGLGAFPL